MGTESHLFYISISVQTGGGKFFKKSKISCLWKIAKNQRQQILQKIQNQLPLKKSPKIKGSKFFKKSKISCLWKIRPKSKAANSSKNPKSVASEKFAQNRRQQILQEIQDQLPLKNSPKIEGSKFFKKSKISCLWKNRQKSKATNSSKNSESVASEKIAKNQRQQILQEIQDQLPLKKSPKIKGN